MKVNNPEITCVKCGKRFILMGQHDISEKSRFRCPSVICATILRVKPIEVLDDEREDVTTSKETSS